MAVMKQVAKPAAKPATQSNVRPIQKMVAKPTNATKSVGGFTVLKGVEIPPKKSFGGKRGVYNDLFQQLELGDCVEVQVEEDKTNVSKMNGLYNAARRNGADITIRIHDAGNDNHGGVLRLWYNGQKEQA